MSSSPRLGQFFMTAGIEDQTFHDGQPSHMLTVLVVKGSGVNDIVRCLQPVVLDGKELLLQRGRARLRWSNMNDQIRLFVITVVAVLSDEVIVPRSSSSSKRN